MSGAFLYQCPDCKTPLVDLTCPTCRTTYEARDGIPILLPRDPKFKTATDIAVAYDSIYRGQSNVWQSQGRTPRFLEYFSSLLSQIPGPRLLEVGCGEGLILGRVAKTEKFGIDLSVEALKRARMTGPAHLSVALAERLPFPSAYFDVIASVGVMEHFLDIDEATSEIRRVLRPGGHYVALTHIDQTLWERLSQKVWDYVLPPRPLQFARWLRTKLAPGAKADLVQQPIQHRYTTRDVKARLERPGLRVTEVLHTRRYSRPPLEPWAAIYVVERQGQ
jgi:ubiquinone/menaquinone biosynthesis C-methylase UbiE